MKAMEPRKITSKQCGGTLSLHPKVILKHHIISAECTKMGGVVQKTTQGHGGWYYVAARRGHPKAAVNLVMYAFGLGGTKNYQMAGRWFLLAADHGDIKAQDNLGVLYENGGGVRRNYVKAYMWFTLAARQSDSEATKHRDRIARLMTPAQIEQLVNYLLRNCLLRSAATSFPRCRRPPQASNVCNKPIRRLRIRKTVVEQEAALADCHVQMRF
jgi:hypothetical protein